ncbi:Permease of the drug/metabolite transporter (DMT) superfamily [Maridesulfovibrio ferrireducens]|uniref:Permease of the drug/metabolite transporter (DMT) superfamily n=1 Tax=Maridesulfovibrio ferrireducens TaxID=246191 RepID=A0A1G9C7X0_9BACT|nr:DMT family transporter [Maridesulfovibrio ferrireducens]SDK47465.1 Permease of the drug/metabolite transporter (DMT) superfamily [Maridesulfovibrio ferrireducens]
MQSKNIKADVLLLITAMIWGTAFVAQRVGMDYVGPLTFNAVRFALGAIALLPLVYRMDREKKKDGTYKKLDMNQFFKGSLITGVVLFLGASLQQWGIVYTTAGNAGFITGLYVVIVPIMGLFFKQKTGLPTWVGALLAVVGMYLLSVNEGFNISFGDLLVLISAFFWAAHVIVISLFSSKIEPIKFAIGQFVACSILSFIGAFILEDVSLSGIFDGAIPILYGGLMSVGVAYTLQVIALQDAKPAHAAIILSLESVFGAIGGCLLLGEVLTTQGLFGCGLMLCGMLISQVKSH